MSVRMDAELNKRWGIWIDIEGFSTLWEKENDLAIQGLRQLTRMVFAIGTLCFPVPPHRLFAHHIGDAFYISSDFREESLDRCAAIAVVLMRGITPVGCVSRASIAEGPLADYAGCRPEEVREAASREKDSGRVKLGEGVMTLQAAMGLGLIKAHNLDKKAQTKGAIVAIDESMRDRLSSGFTTRPLENAPEILAVDWVHSTSPMIDEIVGKAGHGDESPAILRRRLEAYVERHCLPARWSLPTFRYAGL